MLCGVFANFFFFILLFALTDILTFIIDFDCIELLFFATNFLFYLISVFCFYFFFVSKYINIYYNVM